MRLRRPLLAQALLLVSLLGAFGFLDYYSLPAALSFDSLAEVSVLLLFVWLALSARGDPGWAVYVLFPAVALGAFVLLYAYVFTARVDAPLLPSLLAQRYYVFVLLGPVVYLLRGRGWGLPDFRRVFVAAMLLTLMAFVAYDLTISPAPVLLSGEFFVLHLGQTYEDLGAEIRRLNAVTLFLLLYFVRRLARSAGAPFWPFALAVISLSALLLVITIPRALLAATGAALLLYALFLSRPRRAGMAALVLPLFVAAVALLAPSLAGAFARAFAQDRSYVARKEEVQTAWQSVREHPLLGFGQDSVQSVSYQDVFGQLYPADIGLLGVAFQFGVLGLALYAAFALWLCARLLGLLWAHARDPGSTETVFVWTLFIVCLTFLLSSPLQARFIIPGGQGLPIGAFCWGLLVAYGRGRRGHPGPPNGDVRAPGDVREPVAARGAVSP